MAAERLEDRTFGLALGAVFGLLASIGWLVSEQLPTSAIAISVVLVLAALIAPAFLMPLNRVFSWVGRRLGPVINFVLLAVFFYLVIVPFGVVARRLGKLGADSIRKQPDAGTDSYWTPVKRQATAETYPDMF